MLSVCLLAVFMRGGFSGHFISEECESESGFSILQVRQQRIHHPVNESSHSVVGKCNLKNFSFPDYDIPFQHPSATSSLNTILKGSISLQDVVKRIYYINMDRSLDRRTYMENLLSDVKRRTGIPYERVHALEADQDAWLQKKKQHLARSTSQVVGW